MSKNKYCITIIIGCTNRRDIGAKWSSFTFRCGYGCVVIRFSTDDFGLFFAMGYYF